MTFHQKLARLTEDRHKTKVATRAGLPNTTIYRLLGRRQEPSASTALRLAFALGVPVEWLLDDSQGWPPPSMTAPVRSHKERAKVA